MSQPRRAPEWVHKMDAYLSKYAIPFFFGSRPHRTEPSRISAGTCSVVDVGTGPFLLTARHVVDEALGRLNEPRMHCLAGSCELALGNRTLHRHRSRDLATIPVTAEEVATLEHDGYIVVRPPAWPPPPLVIDDAVALSGYPGVWRSELSWDELDFRAFTFLAMVSVIGDTNFQTRLDPDFLVESRMTNEELPLLDVGGLSGGPGFLIPNVSNTLVVAPQLCGVVKEGWQFEGHTIALFERLDVLGSTGDFIG